MEAKKNPRADLNRYRSMMLMAGLALSLGAAVAAFSYSQPEIKIAVIEPNDDRGIIDVLPLPLPPDDPPAPKVQRINVQTDYINIRENPARITTDIDFIDFDPDAPVVVRRPVPQEKPIEDNTPIVIAEFMPEFMGGDVSKFRAWVMERLRYPTAPAEAGIQGKVILSFVIEKDGRLTGIEVLQTPDRLLSEEASRVLALSPQWTPGKQRNTPVRVKYTIPVEFRIN